jgi:hypothetical protein
MGSACLRHVSASTCARRQRLEEPSQHYQCCRRYTADPTLGDFVLVLVFLFVLLAVSALAPPARNHSAFVSFLFVADLLVFGWLFFFADFFVFIGYLLVPLCGIMLERCAACSH